MRDNVVIVWGNQFTYFSHIIDVLKFMFHIKNIFKLGINTGLL